MFIKPFRLLKPGQHLEVSPPGDKDSRVTIEDNSRSRPELKELAVDRAREALNNFEKVPNMLGMLSLEIEH